MCSKVTVKQRLIVFHKPDEWSTIYAQILKDFGLRMAIRSVMQQELGFVYRYHRGLVPNPTPRRDGPTMYYENQVHLDFYSDSAQSWFILKYLNDQSSHDQT